MLCVTQWGFNLNKKNSTLLPTQSLPVNDTVFQIFSIKGYIKRVGIVKLVERIWNCSSIAIIEQKTCTSASKSRVKVVILQTFHQCLQVKHCFFSAEPNPLWENYKNWKHSLNLLRKENTIVLTSEKIWTQDLVFIIGVIHMFYHVNLFESR